MRRLLIGRGTTLGNYLSVSSISFAETLTFEQALEGFRSTDEILLVCPAFSSRRSTAAFDTRLIESLKGRVKRVVALSTVDVYPSKSLPFDEHSAIDLPLDGDEERFSWLRHQGFERRLTAALPQTQIVRLPEVFGAGFVKGVAGHLLGKEICSANRVGIHQLYPAERLSRDLIIARHLKVKVVNLCTEPVRMDRVLDSLLPEKVGFVSTPAPYSRIKTRYSEAFGGSGGYIMTSKDVIATIQREAACSRALRRLDQRNTVPQIMSSAANVFAGAAA